MKGTVVLGPFSLLVTLLLTLQNEVANTDRALELSFEVFPKRFQNIVLFLPYVRNFCLDGVLEVGNITSFGDYSLVS